MSRFEANLQQAQKLIAQGKTEQARASLTRILQKDPLEPWLNNAVAITFVVQGLHTQAHYYASRAVKAAPRNTEFACTLGSILSAMGRHQEAVDVLGPAIAADPAAPNPRLAIANALAGLEQHAAAAQHCREALAFTPADREISVALIQALQNMGMVEEAMHLARPVIAQNPDSPELAAWIPYALNYIAATTPQESLAAHRRFGQVLERSAASTLDPVPKPISVTLQPDRALRIGLVSPDLRTHSVAFFTEPLLEHADRSRLHLTCYSTAAREDDTSRRLEARSDLWRSVPNTPAPELARTIRADKIDILIDLAGNTAGEKLAVFAHRPAPIQITYLGYPNTTGLTCFDYRIVDSRTDPPGADDWCTEKLLRLDPAFLCFRPGPDTPAPHPLIPSAAAGSITFGSFNTLIKLSQATVELWSDLLLAEPTSRLLLKARQLADPRTREQTIARFSARGIDPARIEVLPATRSTADHLALYSRVDVGVDPIPYAGTTTTCEAMWMGVPVVTLQGVMHASRVGASLLAVTAMHDMIAATRDEYISAARRIARDTHRRLELRSAAPAGLRARMAASPLCDGPGFARRFESLLRAPWRAWCARQAPAPRA